MDGLCAQYPVRIVNASSATTFKSEQTGKTKDQHEGTHVLSKFFFPVRKGEIHRVLHCLRHVS